MRQNLSDDDWEHSSSSEDEDWENDQVSDVEDQESLDQHNDQTSKNKNKLPNEVKDSVKTKKEPQLLQTKISYPVWKKCNMRRKEEHLSDNETINEVKQNLNKHLNTQNLSNESILRFNSLGHTMYFQNDSQIQKYIENLHDEFIDKEKEFGGFNDKTDSWISNVFNTILYNYNLLGGDTNKPIFIEFDSLLCEIFSDPLIDQSYSLPSQLQISWMIEQKLTQLSSCNRKIFIIGFETNEHLIQKSNSDGIGNEFLAVKMLARRILMDHILRFTVIGFRYFKSLNCEEQFGFYERKRPSFMLVSDGTSFSNTDKKFAQIFQRIFLILMSQKIECVRISELFFQSKAIYGFRCKLNPLLILHLIEHADKLYSNFNVPTLKTGDDFQPQLYDYILKRIRGNEALENFHDLIPIYTCIRVLEKHYFSALKLGKNEKKNFLCFARFLLAFSYIKQNTNIDKRMSIANTKKDQASKTSTHLVYSNEFEHFLKLFSMEIITFLSSPQIFNLSNIIDFGSYDLVDGYFLHNILAEYFIDSEKNDSIFNLAFSSFAQTVLIDYFEDVRSIKINSDECDLAKSSASIFLADEQHQKRSQCVEKDNQTFAIHNIKSDYVKEMGGELENSLLEKGLVSSPIHTSKTDVADTSEYWVIEDGLRRKRETINKNDQKAVRRTQKAEINYINIMDKYSKSLAGTKIVLRDVIVASKSSDKEQGEGSGLGSIEEKQQNHKGKGGQKKKGKIDRRELILKKNIKKQKDSAKDDMMRFIEHIGKLKSLESQINELSEKLGPISDPDAAIPGQLKLLDLCIKSYKASQPDFDKGPAVRLFQTIHDIFRRFKLDLTIETLVLLQHGLHKLGFEDSAKHLAMDFVDSFMIEYNEKILSSVDKQKSQNDFSIKTDLKKPIQFGKTDNRELPTEMYVFNLGTLPIEQNTVNTDDNHNILLLNNQTFDVAHKSKPDPEEYSRLQRILKSLFGLYGKVKDIQIITYKKKASDLNKHTSRKRGERGEVFDSLSCFALIHMRSNLSCRDAIQELTTASGYSRAIVKLLSNIDKTGIDTDLITTRKSLVFGGQTNRTKLFIEMADDWTDVYVNPRSYNQFEQCESVGMSSIRFQLLYAGHLMVRNVESQYDSRVQGFYPDKWQRKLLDVVDNKESCLVIAPTSSGKTFISYYTMKQILFKNKTIKRPSDKGIVVFVCPTKALVNQTAADVYRRYGQVFGIYTLDYDIRTTECEVLITLPTAFERLLMLPEYEQFCKQIQYVIFDEIHSIGDSLNGEVQERDILMLQCPFIALSATLGNPESFYNWLDRVENVYDRKGKRIHSKVHLITHNERQSDLEKYMYVPHEPYPKIEKLNLGSGRDPNFRTSFYRIHPFGAYQLRSNKFSNIDHLFDDSFELSQDLVFSSSDCLTLYDSMQMIRIKFNNQNFENSNIDRSRIEEICFEIDSILNPEKFFNPLCISKREVREYEHLLKLQLRKQVKCGLKDEVNTILDQITSDVTKRISLMEEFSESSSNDDSNFSNSNNNFSNGSEGLNTSDAHNSQRKFDPYSKQFIQDHFMPLLVDLDKMELLPAIIFSMEWELCDKLVCSVLEYLEKSESKVISQEATPETSRKEKELKRLRKLQKRKRDQKDRNKAEDFDDEMLIVSPQLDDYKPEIDWRFTFCQIGMKMAEDEMEFQVKRAIYNQGWSKNSPLIRCLERGIGVHHDGLSYSYRRLVEVLFRAKHLKVVVTTGTLALGVNMPCRTTVFAGDSPTLTPLKYRQMMGRAGRRGYDNVGHCIFYGITPQKISYLVTSSLFSIHGNYSYNATVGLQTLTNYSRSTDKKFRMRSISNLLNATFDPITDISGISIYHMKDRIKRLEDDLSRKDLNGCEKGREIKNAIEFQQKKLDMQVKKNQSSNNNGAKEEDEVKDLTEQNRYKQRYSLEFLFQIGLIDQNGNPTKYSAIANYLYKSHPSNFLFVYLLENGIFDSICADFGSEKQLLQQEVEFTRSKFESGLSKNEISSNTSTSIQHRITKEALRAKDRIVCSRVIEILSHIFFRIPLPANCATSSSSILDTVILKDLSKDIQRKICEFNQLTIELHTQLFRVVSAIETERQSNCFQLPLSSIFLPNTEYKKDQYTTKILLDKSTIARSPFVALSGKNDYFDNSSELLQTSTQQVHTFFESDSIPSNETLDIQRRKLPLNAYAFNFFTHGNYSHIMKQNCLSEGSAQFFLKDWALLLKSIKHSFSCTLQDGPKHKVYEVFSSLSDEFNRLFDEIGKHHKIGETLLE